MLPCDGCASARAMPCPCKPVSYKYNEGCGVVYGSAVPTLGQLLGELQDQMAPLCGVMLN